MEFNYDESEGFDITSDDLDFDVITSDTDLNIINNPQITLDNRRHSTGNIEDKYYMNQKMPSIWDATIVGEWLDFLFD